MDPTIEYLWAAGYDLPPNTPSKPAETPAADIPRRGKKAAKAKRQKAAK